MKIAKIDLKLKYAKEKSNQIVNKINLYVEKLKTQLSEFSKKYQEYSDFFHTLHLHLKKKMLRNRFETLLKRNLKKLIRQFEHTKIFIEKNGRSRKSDFEKINENNFFYNQFFNVKNDDSVQTAIDRNDYKNQSRNREYRQNRRRENEISSDKTKKSENNNFID